MRRPFISGNWKMNLDRTQIASLCEAIVRASSEKSDVDVGVFPPYPYIGFVRKQLGETPVLVGGQDLYFEAKGAYTGMVSGAMLSVYYGMAKKTNPGLEDDVKFLMKYGESALHIDSLELARSYFQKLYNKSSDYGDEKTKAFSALKLGLINQMFEKYIEAAEYYEGARQYYNARKDMGVVTDIYKAQAYCLRMTGDDKSAITYADGARKTFKKAGYKGAKYDNRVKLILWPVGINIPLIELLPMRYGGSLYPKGFSSAAAEAFLLEMSDKRKDIISDISLKNRQINIFYSSDEKENSIDLWDNVGNRYFQIGYSDSSVASFKKAYKLCMELEEYHGAYIELLNWAEVLFGGYYDSDFTSILMELDEIESKALDLYDYIMPSYPNARANLKNVAGLAEYIIALIKSGSVRTDKRADIQGFLTELDNFTDDLYNRITRARYYFREALSELTPGEYPDVETGLLLNEAVASYSLGDFEGVRSSIKSARRSAVSSGSLRLYGMAAVIDAIINLNGGDNHIELLAGAVRLYEDVPINQNHMVDMPFLMDLYERIIEYYLEKRDAYSSMYYLESLKKMKLVSRLNRINTAFYKSERFKATLDLLQNYQKDVVDLNIERIRLEALGTVGKVKLREINGEILKIRSRILELRREIKELDPAAYSSLVFDQPSVKSLMVHIPKDEVCIVSQKTLKETAIWICRHDSLDLLFVKNLNEFENSKDISVISDYNVVTITAPHNIYWNLKNMIQKRYIGISIKRAYSLSEAYKFEIRDMRRSDGILIVRFDGHVLTDSLADAVGADLISYNSAFPEKDLLKYGWIIFDGKLVEEPRNFLLSYLKGEGNKGKDEAPERLYFKDIPDIKNNAFGLLFVNSGEKTRDENEGILVNLFENTGVQTVVLINDIRDRSILLSGLEGFFSGLMSESPIKSYLNTLNKESIIYPAKPGFKVDYYGEKGWSINDEGLKIKNLYSEYILVGNQYYIQKNWEAAEKYYKLALDIVINREFDDLSTAHAAEKLLETFGQSKEYNKRIEEYFLKFVDVFERTGDLKHMAKIYKDMASIKYDKNEYQESIKYSNVLIGIAEKLEDVPSIADGYAIRGKAFLETGELDMARADLLKAIELFAEGNNEGSALRSGLALAEIFNLQEMYGRAKMTLDSLNIKIDEVEEKGMYYKYLIQMSRYYMGTYRSEAAKKNLEYISEDDRNNAEATILLGKIYLMRGDLDSAFALAQRGKSLLSTGIRRLLVSEMHELMGDIYRVRGMNEESSIQYDLAGQAVMNYKYRKYSDILKYKGVLVADYEDGDKDSLYNQIISDSEIEFVKNLCRYQLGYRAAVKKDGERTQNHFEYILESKDNKTSRRLKWRALYILASIMETKEKSRYLGSAIDLLRDHSIEPDYIKDAYGLHEERADAFNHIADIMIDDNRLKSAINYLEAGYSEKISGRYFSVGNVDSMENDILNLISRDDSEGEYVESENDRLKSINNDLKYAVLWGEKPNSVEHLQDSLRENESVLRYFAADSNFLVAYMDKESIFIHEFEFKESDLSKLLIALGDLLTNQQKADSVMEEWYTELLSPVQRFLEDKEKILIVPDGILHFFPFETLKMPEGDYLSETFTLKRHIYLPVKFPADSYENMIAIPHIGVTDNLDIDLIQYIAEPFSKPLTDTDNCVKFYGGDFSFFGGSFKRDGSIICAVKPFSRDDHLSLALHSIMGARDGGIGFVYPLWDMSDEIKVMFYWKFLRNLADGKGFWNSFKRSRSYIFGHYDGLPDTWGAFVYLCLK